MKKTISFFLRCLALILLKATVFSRTGWVRSVTFDAISYLSPSSFFLVSDNNDRPMLINLDDKIISRHLFKTGEFEQDKLKQCFNLLRSKNIFPDKKNNLLIDVGANIGTVTIEALTTGMFQRAVAIEPHPLNFDLLSSNIIMNKLTNDVQCIQAAASSLDNQTLDLALNSQNFGDHKIISKGTDEKNVLRVNSVTCDSLFDDFDFDQNNVLLWIDAQGFEGSILEGSKKFINRKIPMVLEFWPYGMHQHNGMFERLLANLTEYSSFFELDGENEKRSIKELKNLYEEIGHGEHKFTDILVV